MSRRRRPKLIWSPRARADLLAIAEFIAADDPAAAERWVRKLVGAMEMVASTPRAARMVPELRRDDLREVLVRTYRIVFRVAESTIEVVTVFEGHQRLRVL